MNDFVIQLVARTVVILAIAFILTALLRRASASSRYLIWAVALATIVALPVALIVIPKWNVQMRVPERIERFESTIAPISAPPSDAVESSDVSRDTRATAAFAMRTTADAIATSRPIPPAGALIALYIIGVIVTLGRMIVGRISLKRIARHAVSLETGDWQSLLDRERARLSVERKIELLSSSQVSTPLAAGIRSPMIILPAGASQWSDAHREVVIRHELAHIARKDAVVCLISGVACAIYWLNPLVWIASRKLRTEQERSCDDRVITLGTNATDYAEHLLAVARSARNIGMHSFVSVAMARPSQLEGRLLAVLQNRRRGNLTSRGAVAVSALAFTALVVLSALRPVRADAIVIASQAELPFVTVYAPRGVAVTKTVPVADKVDSTVIGEVNARSGGTLYLDLKTGAGVQITGSDENRVRVRGRLAGRDWRNTAFEVTNDGPDARVSMYYTVNRSNTSSSNSLTITVPRRYNVRIKSSGGEITIRDVEGDFSGSTGGGEIDIANARGNAELSTGGGSVHVRNSHLSGSVTTGGGPVTIDNVSGGLRGGSGTGDVAYGGSGSAGGVSYSDPDRDGARKGSDGKTYVRKSGGSVSLGNVGNGASINTGGGDIKVGESRGEVEISTGGGDIVAGPLYNGGRLTTGAGDVQVTIAGSGGSTRIESGNGTVTLILPRNLNADLELETAFTRQNRQTRIESDWPLSTTVTPDWDTNMGTPRRYVRARQSI
ncbi:MAG TPA: M56 family metallopeptidase, partial [Gemmatimonadaceae bacterium]